jgi:hypothetical protein
LLLRVAGSWKNHTKWSYQVGKVRSLDRAISSLDAGCCVTQGKFNFLERSRHTINNSDLWLGDVFTNYCLAGTKHSVALGIKMSDGDHTSYIIESSPENLPWPTLTIDLNYLLG